MIISDLAKGVVAIKRSLLDLAVACAFIGMGGAVLSGAAVVLCTLSQATIPSGLTSTMVRCMTLGMSGMFLSGVVFRSRLAE